MTMYGKPAEEVEAEYLEALLTDRQPVDNPDDGAVGRRKKP